jgi:hypothetical protein
MIVQIITCEIDSGIRFLGSDPVAPGACYWKNNRFNKWSFKNQKYGSGKEAK